LQRFYKLKSFYFSIISSYIDQILTKNTPYYRASKALSISALVKFFRSVLDPLIKKNLKIEIFVKENLLQELLVWKDISHNL
jgi:hypothetical protein